MGQLRFNYEYVTDPPLLADMGIFRGILNKTSILIDGSAHYDIADSHFQIILFDFLLDTDPFLILFDGISDLGDMITRLITYVGNVLRSRLLSVVGYVGRDRIAGLINKLLELVPDTIPIPLKGH